MDANYPWGKEVLPSKERAIVGMMILVMLLTLVIYQFDSLDINSVSSEVEMTQTDMNTIAFIGSDDPYVSPSWIHTTTNPEYLRPVAISGDGSTIVEGAGNFLRLFNSTSNESIWVYNAESTILDCAISENGSLITISTLSGLLITFDKTSNSPKWISSFSGYAYYIAMSENGSRIVAGDTSGFIYAFSHQSNESVWKHNATYPISSIAVSGDGSTIIAGDVNKNVRVFDFSSNQSLWEYQFVDLVGAVSVCRNGSYLAVGSQQGAFLFTRISNNTLWSYEEEFDSIQISDDGSTIAATKSQINTYTLFVWDSNSNQTLWKYNGTERFTRVAMTETGSRMVAGGYGNESIVFGRNSNASIIRHPCQSYIIDVAITSEGHAFVTSCGNGHTYYFSLVGPTITSVTPNKGYYNTSENAIISAEIQKGTTNLVECVLWYSFDGIEFHSKVMANESLMTDAVITFNTSLGLSTSNVTYYVITCDKLEYEASSIESKIMVDGFGPNIRNPVHTPSSPTSSEDVIINVNVTDSLSGVQFVMINYSSSIGEWTQEEMIPSDGSTFVITIPELPNGTVVQYYIIATDSVENTNINDNSGNYFEYTVVDESTFTTTQTPPTNTTPQPGGPLSLLYGAALIAGIAISATIIIACILHKKSNVSERDSPTTTEPSLDESTIENTDGERE